MYVYIYIYIYVYRVVRREGEDQVHPALPGAWAARRDGAGAVQQGPPP